MKLPEISDPWYVRYSGAILFGILIILGLSTFSEYGLSWDEPRQRITGLINFNYVFHSDQDLLSWRDRDYGVAFGLPLIIIEKALGLEDTQAIFQMRSLVTHLFFLLGCWFLFKIVRELYNSRSLSILAVLILVLHPRIYGHSFFNSKDIPFLSMMIISMYYTVRAFSDRRVLSFIILGIFSALLINIRVIGLMVPILVSCILIGQFSAKERRMEVFKNLSALVLSASLILFISWPFLWTNPVENFASVVNNMSKFRWTGEVFFKGEFLQATNLPWTYIPLWFIITTPIVYQLLALLGILLIPFATYQSGPGKFWKDDIHRNNLIFLFYFLAPVAAVILRGSVLYDDWRHLYFIYPSFVLLCVFALFKLLNPGSVIKRIIVLLLFISFSITAFRVYKSFPLQHVLFNEYCALKPAEHLRHNFELDYWGLSYRKALEQILESDSSEQINVSFENPPGGFNLKILSKQDRLRFRETDLSEADYFLTEYRWHPEDYTEFAKLESYSIKIDGNTVSSTFKLR